jgi:hypothetical protein
VSPGSRHERGFPRILHCRSRGSLRGREGSSTSHV